MPKPTPKKATERDLIRIATFILFDAAIFHDALTGTVVGLTPLRAAKAPYSTFLLNEWDRILAVNYSPVFEIARDVLKELPASPRIESILKSIIDGALDVVSSGILLKHDFMGRVYHKLLLRTTGQYYATYYTSIPAASLLANLVFKTENPAWKIDLSDLAALGEFNVIDCACGSGTLLSASYMALKDRYILSGPVKPNLSSLHKILVERVLSGWDVLDYAAHLTLTSLALHSTRTSITRSNIYVVPAGVSEAGAVHLGSLDRLQTNIAFVGRGFSKHAVLKGLSETREETIPERRYDVVIMNPPFSRSANPNIKFGYSDKAARLKMNRALNKLAESLTLYGYDASAIGNAGLSAYFMFLAGQLVKLGGRVAAVLPRSTLSGVAFAKVREAFLRDFHIEYIISNSDPGDPPSGIDPWNFSENTDIGEVMIVARRRDGQDVESLANERTCFVGLWRKPWNEVAALLYSQQIIKKARGLEGDIRTGTYNTIVNEGVTAGTLYLVGRDDLQQNWLAPAVFASPELNRMLLATRSSKGLVPLKPLACGYGYDIRWLKDAFEKTSGPTAYRIVWGHQGAMNTLVLDHSHVGYGRPKHGQKSEDIFHKYSSNLLIAERPHLSTECGLAFVVGQPVMGTAFWELRLNDPTYAQVLALWLASTFGFMLFLGIATSSQGDIVKLKKDQLRELLVPDPLKIDVSRWCATFNSLATSPLGLYRDQFLQAAEGKGLRFLIDHFVGPELGLTTPQQTEYELLAAEPIISKRRL